MATQTEIAAHLDMSERNLRDVLNVLRLDHRSASLDDIRIAYIRDLRDKAAGRGGDDHQSLTRARTRDALASAELRELQIQEKAGQLVPVELIEPRLTAMVTAARQELLALPDKLANELKALHDIDIDAGLIQEHIHDALNHLANDLHGDPAGDDDAGASALGTAA